MKVKTDYDGCSYITAGKEYEVIFQYNEHLAFITDDTGCRVAIYLGGKCEYLNTEGEWEVVQESPELDWTPWDGGECPVPDGHDVSVLFGDGAVERDDEPEEWGWGWYGRTDPYSGEIIGYYDHTARDAEVEDLKEVCSLKDEIRSLKMELREYQKMAAEGIYFTLEQLEKHDELVRLKAAK